MITLLESLSFSKNIQKKICQLSINSEVSVIQCFWGRRKQSNLIIYYVTNNKFDLSSPIKSKRLDVILLLIVTQLSVNSQQKLTVSLIQSL